MEGNVLKYIELEKLEKGKKYIIIETDYDDEMNIIEKKYVGEYRGWPLIPDWEEYLLFWIEGDSCAEFFHYGDIKVMSME